VLKKFPWTSWILFLVTYAVFGWIAGSENFFLSHFISNQMKLWGAGPFVIEHIYWIQNSIKIVETSLIFVITLFLSDSLRVLNTVIRKPFSSNVLTFFYILLWSSLIPVILAWFSYFIRFIIILAAALLLRIDMQRYGFKHSITTLVVCLSGIIAFMFGLVVFQLWGDNVRII